MVWLLWTPLASVQAQLAPEIGYVHPAGGAAGQSFEAVLGGYDWSPDMQVFSHDPRVRIEIVGSPSGVLVPDPPYWFGAKARGPAWPLPREFPARITVAGDVAPTLVKWQAANANGASPIGYLHIGGGTQVVEETRRQSPQRLPSLPVAISGQIRLIEEIDRYEFQTTQAGPVTISVVARQIGSPLHAARSGAGRRGTVGTGCRGHSWTRPYGNLCGRRQCDVPTQPARSRFRGRSVVRVPVVDHDGTESRRGLSRSAEAGCFPAGGVPWMGSRHGSWKNRVGDEGGRRAVGAFRSSALGPHRHARRSGESLEVSLGRFIRPGRAGGKARARHAPTPHGCDRLAGSPLRRRRI